MKVLGEETLVMKNVLNFERVILGDVELFFTCIEVEFDGDAATVVEREQGVFDVARLDVVLHLGCVHIECEIHESEREKVSTAGALDVLVGYNHTCGVTC